MRNCSSISCRKKVIFNEIPMMSGRGTTKLLYVKGPRKYYRTAAYVHEMHIFGILSLKCVKINTTKHKKYQGHFIMIAKLLNTKINIQQNNQLYSNGL